MKDMHCNHCLCQGSSERAQFQTMLLSCKRLVESLILVTVGHNYSQQLSQQDNPAVTGGFLFGNVKNR